MMAEGSLQPDKLIDRAISLDRAADELVAMDRFAGVGVTVIDAFGGTLPG